MNAQQNNGAPSAPPQPVAIFEGYIGNEAKYTQLSKVAPGAKLYAAAPAAPVAASGPLPPLPAPHWKANGSFSADQMEAHARLAWNMGLNAGLLHQQGVVYPEDGTTSPFTVINLGSGQVKIGDSVHDARLPALWFGKNGLGMGVEETMNRAAAEGETLAVVTFGNVEALDVLLEVVVRIRRIAFPGAPGQQPAGHLKHADLVKLGHCRAELWARLDDVDAVPVYLDVPTAGRAA